MLSDQRATQIQRPSLRPQPRGSRRRFPLQYSVVSRLLMSNESWIYNEPRRIYEMVFPPNEEASRRVAVSADFEGKEPQEVEV